MPIIGVVGADGIQSLIPDRAKIEQRVEDEWRKYLASKPKFPVRTADGSIDRDASIAELKRFGAEEFNRLPFNVYDPNLPHDEGQVFFDLIAQLIAAVSEADSLGNKPVVRVFLDP